MNAYHLTTYSHAPCKVGIDFRFRFFGCIVYLLCAHQCVWRESVYVRTHLCVCVCVYLRV
jgi:hypothetical protein